MSMWYCDDKHLTSEEGQKQEKLHKVLHGVAAAVAMHETAEVQTDSSIILVLKISPTFGLLNARDSMNLLLWLGSEIVLGTARPSSNACASFETTIEYT